MTQPQTATVAHVDVLIVGAGISGLGAAHHLKEQCPWASFLILEAHESYGGTWLIHKYPGVRSDSDLYTFGYRFKPWTGHPIASGEEIQRYLGEVIAEDRLDERIRYRHKIKTARWSTADKKWTIDAVETDADGTETARRFTCNFLWMCQGYYRHERGYTPDWPGMSEYRGQIVHPQTWPDDIDLKGKRVIVIGSGATAATLVPAIAGDTEHVTLLQRSPTYFVPGRNVNDLADTLRELDIDESWIHEIVRRSILHQQEAFVQQAKNAPEETKAELLAGPRLFLGPDYDVEKHFTPRYRPWQQRIAFVPDGDLFVGIRSGKASVVTDEIERFTEKGILLKSGDELTADIIITATGFDLSPRGDIDIRVDGVPVDNQHSVTYRGMMQTGIPNMVWIMGYFRASWTLRVDLVGDFVCHLLNHMRDRGVTMVEVALRPEDEGMQILDWIDEDDFSPGYLKRGIHLMAKRGTKPEWRHNQNYWQEKDELPTIDLDDPAFVYS
ncbi:MAG: NAD(P)/FAD-dependent oxidoreductase [Pseudomonadota bacterium]